MRIYKPRFKRNGEFTKLSRWYIEFRDHNRTRRRVPAFGDKQVSEALGRQIEALVGVRVTRQQPRPELTKWLEGLPDDLRRKLAAFGLIDDKVLTLSHPLGELVDNYHAALMAKGNTPDHADLRRIRLLKAIDGCGFSYWRDIRAGSVEQWLAGQRAEGMKERTSNHYVVGLKGFCNWMVTDGRAAGSPLQRLKGVPVTDEQERGVFTADQVRALLRATHDSSGICDRMDGPTRALLYRLAVETGLRAGALRSLTPASFKFTDQGGAIVTVEAGQQKNRRKHRIPLRAEFAAEIRSHIARTAGDAPLFNIQRDIARTLQEDLESAALPLYDADGHKLVFHSLRHTTGTWLDEAGVPTKVIQHILGHRTFAMTADRYTHSRMERVAKEIEKLPDLRMTGTDERAAYPICAQTGTVDVPSGPQVTIDTRDGAVDNAVSTRWGGRVVEGAGLENR